jgi:long-chain-fatty-acid--CoA ligase ACSBG
MLDIFMPVLTGAKVYFALPDALKGTLAIQLQCVRPTLFFGVPRVWEKIHEKMMEVAKKLAGTMAAKAGAWAKKQGSERNERAQFGHTKGGMPLKWAMAHLILNKIHKKIGLNKCRGCFTGAAPISPKILNYFASIDVPIYELFGQSECTGPHTMNFPGFWKIGTCGRKLEGTEMRVDAETGELQYRGRHIFMGYLKNEEETKKTVNPEGWLCSGDQAKIDEDGFMSITGRIKELIITAGGENIPPVIIEDNMMTHLGGDNGISNVMVIGEKQKFLSMIVCPQCHLDDEGEPTTDLGQAALQISIDLDSMATNIQMASECEKWQKHVQDLVTEANKTTTSNAQKITKFCFADKDFSIGDDTLTPTMKLKRKIVSAKYDAKIKAMYGDAFCE